MNNHSLKHLLLILLLAAAVVSCGSERSTDRSYPVNDESPPAEIEETQLHFTSLQGSDGFSWGAYGSDGFYYGDTILRQDGSCNLKYVDYESERDLFLCAQPNCNHDTDQCTSYLIPTPGGVLVEYVGNHLLLFYLNSPFPDSESKTCSRVESAEYDGSNRKTICEFGAGELPQKPMLTDGEKVYFYLWKIDNDAKETADFVALDPNTGELCVLREMDTATNERIWGTDGESILIYRYTAPISEPDWKCELVKWNPQNNNESIVYQWSPDESYPFLADNVLAFKGTDKLFHLIQLDTMDDIGLSQYELSENHSEKYESIMYADKTHILFRVSSVDASGSYSESYYMLDVDGNQKEWNLLFERDGEAEPYLPITEISQDRYLLFVGEDTKMETGFGTDGSSANIQVPRKVYAIMDKEDYWNGAPDPDAIIYIAN